MDVIVIRVGELARQFCQFSVVDIQQHEKQEQWASVDTELQTFLERGTFTDLRIKTLNCGNIKFMSVVLFISD